MQVFISYSSKDIEYAQQMVEAIRANGIDVWYAVDSIRTGEAYSQEIVNGIKNSDRVLMLLSEHSLSSKHVQIELTLALDKNVKIYPVRLEDILPADNMEYYFITSQWYDLFYENFTEEVSKFVNLTFPKKNISVNKTTDQEVIPLSQAVAEVNFSNLDVESVTPQEYDEKSFFESQEEYLNRHLNYGYVAVSTFELINSNYNFTQKEFTLVVDKSIVYNTITIEPSEAKKLSLNSTNRHIYQKFTLEDDSLVKSWFVIHEDKVHKLAVSKLEKEKQKAIFKVLFDWADKNNISQDTFPRDIDMLISRTKLNLSNNQITEVPKEIGALVKLTALNLSNNQITEVPKEIGALVKLTALDLSNNQITEVPKEIGALVNLTILNLPNNQITVVPKEIGALVKLTILNLPNNQITVLPKEIGALVNLTGLWLDKNQITVVPKEIGALVKLTTLNFYKNQITVVPKEIGALVNLTILSLAHNQITVVPKEMVNLVNLTKLYLANNQLTELPNEIWNLANLKIDMRGNNITGI